MTYKCFFIVLSTELFYVISLLISFPSVRSEEQDSDVLCCWKTSGSCRTICEQISLAKISADSELREKGLIALQNFCSKQLTHFWECINNTLTGIERGTNWSGRRCCHLPQSGKCQRACVTSTSSQDLLPSCRQSDEITFFACLDKQELGDECCANAKSADCFTSCQEVFRTPLTPERGVRNAVVEFCGETSPKVINCIKNFTKVTPASNAHRFTHCCDKTLESRCKDTCQTVLKTKTTGQEIVDALQEGGCGPPLPHKKLWQCFLQKPEGNPEYQNAKISRIDRMGIDSAKLHCCNKATTNACRRLCTRTFSDEWAKSWKDFDKDCLSNFSEDKLQQCLDEIEEPCELGCDGLSYCTNFNNRPIELFRSCNMQADDAARYDVTLWRQQGFLSLPGGIQILVKNISQCSPDLWKAVACALQVKPCQRQSHANKICREDCYEMLTRCMDWSKVPPDQTAALVCSKLSSVKVPDSCISLKPFLEFSNYPYVEPGAEVTSPCKGDPCGPEEMCTINRNCQKARPCQPYICRPGCKMGEVSQYVVPFGSYVRIPVPTENRGCQKICQCTRNGLIERCQPMPCVPLDNCWLANKKIDHGSWFQLDCNICSCTSGEITCSKRQCPASKKEPRTRSFTSLPCNCPPHHVPVCGRNGNTYPNSCLAKCAGLRDADFEFGPCSAKNACDPNPCGEGFKCVALKKVCLSLLEKPCKQYICVDLTLTCSELVHDPVCDTEQNEHINMCYLAKSEKKLSYAGSCLPDCQNDGPVCGIDGETYGSECSALANYILVDYRGPCVAIGLISDEARAQCGPAIACPRLPPSGCHAITPAGACCPICAGALRLLYSRKQVDRALYALRGVTTNALTVPSLLKSLHLQIQVAECTLAGYLTVELDIFVAVVARPTSSKISELQREVCVREAEKLASLVQRGSPRFLSDLGLSSLTAATVVHVIASSGIRIIKPVYLWVFMPFFCVYHSLCYFYIFATNSHISH